MTYEEIKTIEVALSALQPIHENLRGIMDNMLKHDRCNTDSLYRLHETNSVSMAIHWLEKALKAKRDYKV